MPENLTLHDGHALPALGFGLYKVAPEDAAGVVEAGLAAGYRLVDGAELYGNEAEAGHGIRRALDGGLERTAITVTSKAWGEGDQSRDATLRAFDASEHALGEGVGIDLYMIHWPRPARGEYPQAWRALVELQQQGRVRSIGVSNFTEEHLARIVDETGVVPVVNQVESHPWLPQHDLRAFHERRGIVTQAWSPLGRSRVLEDPEVVRIAREHGASPAQVIIRWHLQLGGAAIPKSSRPERLRENLAVDDLELTAADLAAIAALETGERTGTHPDDRQ